MLSSLGYGFLIETFGLEVLEPLQRRMRTTSSLLLGTRQEGAYEETLLPQRVCPSERWQDHLLYAVKNEGINLEVLRALYAVVDPNDLAALIKERPFGRTHRRVWFFYEWLTGQELPLPPLQQGTYEPALDPRLHVALPNAEATRAKRPRVLNNLLGSATFCPIVRRTERLQAALAQDLHAQISEDLARYPEELLYRANQYLYLKETKSSFAIEHQTPDQRRTAAFVALLGDAGRQSISEDLLVHLQNAVVDSRYAEHAFRTDQVFVGQTVTPGHEKVHFVGLRPKDLPEFMPAFLTMAQRLTDSSLHPIVAAALVSFLFVFIHPFDDGNGRLHRYLLHHVLAAKAFGPKDLPFPVSAVLLRHPQRYDAVLESFSRRLMLHLNFSFSPAGELLIDQETASFYRYIDCTFIVEECFDFVREALTAELLPELDHLALWDELLPKLHRVVNMPDQQVQRFARIVLDNNGKLSAAKRRLFAELSDEEISALETIITQNLHNHPHTP